MCSDMAGVVDESLSCLASNSELVSRRGNSPLYRRPDLSPPFQGHPKADDACIPPQGGGWRLPGYVRDTAFTSPTGAAGQV